jgi:DNA-binding LacI/PurR family transcriptional regulator
LRRPLYKQIYDELRQKILNHEFAANQQLPTEAELASMFGVSLITSKRALMELEREGLIYRKRGSGSFVRPRAKFASLSPGDQKDRRVAIVLPLRELDSTGLLDYIRGAAEAFETRGYYLSVHGTGYSVPEEEIVQLSSLPKKGVKGVIFYPIRNDMNAVELFALVMNGYPVVTIDKYFDGFPIKYVAADNVDGGYQAAAHLIRLGHTRIAFVAHNGLDKATTIKNRFFGYCKALQEHGIRIESKLTVTNVSSHWPANDRKESYCRLVDELMKRDVTAVQAENDLVAIEVLKACLVLGLKVPEDLSIIGFDNTELSSHVDVPLTSVEQNFYLIGKTAAELLMEGIESGSIQSGPVLTPVRLVVRQSTGPCKRVALNERPEERSSG